MKTPYLFFVLAMASGLHAQPPYSEPALHPHTIEAFKLAIKSQPLPFIERYKAYGSLDKGHTDGLTYLHYAIILDNFRLAQELLNRGADPLVANDAGLSALHLAARDDRLEILDLLLQRVPFHIDLPALPPKIDTPRLNYHVNQRGATPLFWAVVLGQEATVRFLIEHKARLDVPNDLGVKPLRQAMLLREKYKSGCTFADVMNTCKYERVALAIAEYVLQERSVTGEQFDRAVGPLLGSDGSDELLSPIRNYYFVFHPELVPDADPQPEREASDLVRSAAAAAAPAPAPEAPTRRPRHRFSTSSYDLPQLEESHKQH